MLATLPSVSTAVRCVVKPSSLPGGTAALSAELRHRSPSLRDARAGSINVRVAEPRWTDSFSHGELLRVGHDERMEVDPANLLFIFQGLADEHWGRQYGRLSWRLGLLEPLDNDDE